MIDVHIHMIPGVDDGAQDMTMSMAMVASAMEQGVDEMILTPHHFVPNFVCDKIDEQFNLLKEEIRSAGIDFKIHLGNEIHANEESISGIEEGVARTMGESNYLLIELPPGHFYPFHEAMLFDLQMKGYRVLLAHVERYRVFRQNEGKLQDLISRGFYGQLSCRYVVERKTRKQALNWISQGYIHVIASDSHNTVRRPSLMKAAYDVVSKNFGTQCADQLLTENPRRIIQNKELVDIEVEKPKVSFKDIIRRVMERLSDI